MTFDFMKWLDAQPIRLTYGVGDPNTGGCWMAAISAYSGASWGDHPPCVCPVITELCIRINDALSSDDARGRIIGPRLLDPIGTAGDEQATRQRMWILVDAAVRRWVPLALRAAGMDEHAKRLEGLEPVSSRTAAAAVADAYAAAAAAAAAYAYAAAADADAAAAYAYTAVYAAADAAAAARAADGAADAAAARAADGAADAARAAAVADAYVDARDQWVVDHMMPVLDDLLAVGSYIPVEMACDVESLDRAVQRVEA